MRKEQFGSDDARHGSDIPGRATLRVLLVEDDEEDYLIARDLLSEIERIRFVVDWATNPDEARARMESARYDICLLDYRLGRHNGLELIGVFREQGFRAPIILLTGQDDYDTDQQAMAAGASDYLVKGRIDPRNLERTIRYAIDQKRAEAELRRQTQFVSTVLDTAGALVAVLDRTGRVVRFNRACEITTGFAAHEVKGHFLWESVLPPDEAARVSLLLPNLTPDFFPNAMESVWRTKTGDLRRIAWRDSAILDVDGGIEYIVSTGIDVTEQRQAEQELRTAREREIEVGASIQRTLLVRRAPENLVGATVGAYAVPSQKIGGDYFDFFVYAPDQFDVLVGDVMGKGVPAALLAAAAKSHFQRAVRRLCLALAPFHRLPEPQEILAAVHSDLTTELIGLESYITLVYARFDLQNKTVRLVECGHPHPLHLRARDGVCFPLQGDNLPLGMNSGDELYTQSVMPFEMGDTFFFYSDGLTEATDSTGETYFGEETLISNFTQLCDDTPQQMCENVCQAVRRFAEKSPNTLDDLSCIAVRIGELPAPDRPVLWDNIEFAADLDNLEPLRTFLSGFFLRAELFGIWPDEEWQALFVLAANEAVTNCIKHAYAGQDGKHRHVQLDIAADKAQIRLMICDWGVSFVPQDVRTPSFDGSRDNGFGLFIIYEAMDAVAFGRDTLGRNTLLLSKRLKEPQHITNEPKRFAHT